ncbi:MAG TPA: sulfotransferase, partial [Bacteroidetes bacterium]|nr:sulfotransferase [Bacteroidota bacterium]
MIGPEGENLIFVVSQPRAGSTLLQRILGGHPQVHTTAEPWIMLHPLFGLKKSGIHAAYDHALGRQALEDFCSTLPDGREACLRAVRAMGLELYNSALAGTGKSRFLDKTPRYYFILPELSEVFPRASLVLLFRNPLAVLSSILDSWLSWGKWWENEAIAQYRYDLLEAPRRLIEGREALGGRAVT